METLRGYPALDAKERDMLRDELVTIQNLLDLAFILDDGEEVEKESHLATILEIIFEQCQAILDNHCVVRE